METQDRVWQSDILAAHYLEGVRGAIPLAADQIHILLHLVQTAVPNPRHMLDLGCGDGILGRALVDRFPDAHEVFLDFSDFMLDAAREKLGHRANAHTFICQDYGDPSWSRHLDHRPFDVIVSGFSIHHQTDARKKALYQEIYDCLSPGGIFLNLEHVASTTPWSKHVFDEYFIDALHRAHVENGGPLSREEIAQEYYHRPDKTANILAPVETQSQWLRQIGFQDVDCFFKVFELALFGGRKPVENS